MGVKEFGKKLVNAALWVFTGYEIGEKIRPDTIVERVVEREPVHISGENSTPNELTISLIFLIVILIIIAIVKACVSMNNKQQSGEIIRMRERSAPVPHV